MLFEVDEARAEATVRVWDGARESDISIGETGDICIGGLQMRAGGMAIMETEAPGNQAPSLVNLLELKPAGEGRFTGRLQDLGRGRAYGGIVISQALAAGMLSVPDRLPHSLHAYFLLPGDPADPIGYEVESVRDGRSFTTRRIQAIQGDQIIFTMLLSFQEAEQGLEHQDPMPKVPAPEDLPSDEELLRRYLEGLSKDHSRQRNPSEEEALSRYLEELQKNDSRSRAASAHRALFELRHVYPGGFFGSAAPRSENRFWFRAIDPLPSEPLFHYCALAYASDFGPMATALLPHGKAPVSGDVRLASIDHALWFHREARLDDWLLYDLVTPSSQAGRGLSFGRIFARDGRLIASTAQEGIMRLVLR